eukprot:1133964_1
MSQTSSCQILCRTDAFRYLSVQYPKPSGVRTIYWRQHEKSCDLSNIDCKLRIECGLHGTDEHVDVLLSDICAHHALCAENDDSRHRSIENEGVGVCETLTR